MFNFEGLIPKVCLLAQETGNDEQVQQMRCAGLQALSSMVHCVTKSYLGLVYYTTMYFAYSISMRIIMRTGFLISFYN